MSVLHEEPTHVPAWKKLGLKLKYAKDNVESPGVFSVERSNGAKNEEDGKTDNDRLSVKSPPAKTIDTGDKAQKRKREPSSNKSDESNKSSKSRHSKHFSDYNDESLPQTPSPAISSRQSTNLPSELNNDEEPLSERSKERKSVSFTPETKTQDGQGVKHLYQKWIAAQAAEDPTFNSSKLSPALRLASQGKSNRGSGSNEDTQKNGSNGPVDVDRVEQEKGVAISAGEKAEIEVLSLEQRRQAKRRKKEIRQASRAKAKNDQPVIKGDRNSISQTSEAPAYLTYLRSHHASPADWKFSKTQQNHLLKHVCSLRHIPSNEDAALLHYVQGLQGAKARARLREEALSIRSSDDEWINTPQSDSPQAQVGDKGAQTVSEQTNSVSMNKDEYVKALDGLRQSLKDCDGKFNDLKLPSPSLPDEELNGRMQKRQRAEILLLAVGEREEKIFPEPQKESRTPAPPSTPVQQTEPQVHASRTSIVPNAEPEIDGVKGAVQVQVNGSWMLGRDAAKLNGTKGIAPKKVVFGEDDHDQQIAGVQAAPTPATHPASNGLRSESRTSLPQAARVPTSQQTPAAQPKKRKQARKRRSRRSVAAWDDDDDDDDSSSSSSSSDSSSSSEDENEGGTGSKPSSKLPKSRKLDELREAQKLTKKAALKMQAAQGQSAKATSDDSNSSDDSDA